MADSLWTAPPAGTPFAPARINSSHYSQVYSKVPISGDQWQAGRTGMFHFKCMPEALVHLPSSKLEVDFKISCNATESVKPSLRLQHDPISCLFEQAKFSVNGVIVDSVGANYADHSRMNAKLNDTLDGTLLAGSAGAHGFRKDMANDVNVKAAAAAHNQDSKATTAYRDEALDPAHVVMRNRSRVYDSNPKQQILQRANDKKFRLSTGCALPFWREQPKALGQNAECALELTIAQDWQKHMFYSEDVPGEASINGAAIIVTNTGVNETGAASANGEALAIEVKPYSGVGAAGTKTDFTAENKLRLPLNPTIWYSYY